MRVLIVTPTFSPDVGGVETMLDNLCAHLSSRKVHVDIVTYSPLIANTHAPVWEKRGEGAAVWRVPWIGFGLFNFFEHYPPIQFLYLVPGLLVGTFLFLITHPRPDIIHAFGLSGSFAAGLLSRLFNIPCVSEMCTVYRLPERPLLAKLVRPILNWSNYVRGNGVAGRQELIHIGLGPDMVGMMEPPVDETIFKPMPQSEARAILGLPEKVYIALFVGRMVDSKGVDVAVEATRFVKRNMTFVFVGEGPLRYLVEEVAVGDKRVRLVNNVPHHDLVHYYNAADVLMGTPVDSELLAFVGREALMCGLPILAPTVATYHGISYAVNPNLIPPKVGRLIEPTPESLAACLTELLDLKETYQTSPYDRATCRQFALDRYSSLALDWIGNCYQKATRGRSAIRSR